MCRQPLSTFYFFCFNILCAQSENTTIAPAMIAVSFITSLPAPVSSGNPCSPLPKSGTHTSGVVTRKRERSDRHDNSKSCTYQADFRGENT